MPVVDKLLEKAAQLQASDLHISEKGKDFVRIHGELKVLDDLVPWTLEKYDRFHGSVEGKGTRSFPFSVAEAQSLFPGSECKMMQLFRPILPEKQRFLLRDKGECDFAYSLPSGHRFRINLYRSMGDVNAAIRIIPETVPSCQELQLPEAVERLSSLKSGLVLITGVTGSGKSTTMAAILNEINLNRAVHILTLEDPVEYKFIPVKSMIHQREIGNDSENFPASLRAALREDPDVIMVGELRDLETIATAVTAAETGHLVFSTLHTRNASETINRITDVFPEQQQRQIRIQLAGSLQAVISQQLLPVREGGRIAAFEIMIVTPALRNLIREGKTQQMDSYIQTGGQYGMQTMDNAIDRLRRGGKL